jgi:hypothetical protein
MISYCSISLKGLKLNLLKVIALLLDEWLQLLWLLLCLQQSESVSSMGKCVQYVRWGD